MNPYTGELIGSCGCGNKPDVIKKLMEGGFMPVPNELREMADRELQDKDSVILPQDHH